jgi:hypothetical protein
MLQLLLPLLPPQLLPKSNLLQSFRHKEPHQLMRLFVLVTIGTEKYSPQNTPHALEARKLFSFHGTTVLPE